MRVRERSERRKERICEESRDTYVRMHVYVYSVIIIIIINLIMLQRNEIQPIHSACYQGHENVVQLLVGEYGVDPNTPMNFKVHLSTKDTDILF